MRAFIHGPYTLNRIVSEVTQYIWNVTMILRLRILFMTYRESCFSSALTLLIFLGIVTLQQIVVKYLLDQILDNIFHLSR